MISPKLDKNFKPFALELKKYIDNVLSSGNSQKIIICVERQNHLVYRREMFCFKDGINDALNIQIIERFVKMILWVVGGFKIYISGSKTIYNRLKKAYSYDGERSFDVHFMETVFDEKMEVVYLDEKEMPQSKSSLRATSNKLNGRRVGLDVGGSDIKVSAIKDGEVIYDEEVVWLPKLQEDIQYQYDYFYNTLKKAIDHLGGDVDGIGVSTAGVIVDCKPMVSSIFIKIPNKDFEKVKYSYINTIKKIEDELGHSIVYNVVNDGDVTAVAGVNDLDDGGVLGLAFGTSEAGGYVNVNRQLEGWFSELAFAPVDLQDNAPIDEWSGDKGVGCKYFSQDAVIRLAVQEGIVFENNMTLAEKLKYVQLLAEQNNQTALDIFETIGVYLGYTIAMYAQFYQLNHVLILGRVTSGIGGDIILKFSNHVLHQEFSEFSKIDISMPSEHMRRLGQSVAAASIISLEK